MGLLLGLAIGALAVGAFKHSEAVATNQAANSIEQCGNPDQSISRYQPQS